MHILTARNILIEQKEAKMKCKLVANRDSGNFDKLNIDKLLYSLGCDADVETIDGNSNWNADGFDTVIVCGGDGTLSNAVCKCRGKRLVYIPCGTLNETAATAKTIDKIMQVNDNPFSYVCATGSFTEIGYSAAKNKKKQWKALAYLPQVAKNYRCHAIDMRLDVDGKIFEGTFTLFMVLKSHRCFGFCFNKDYFRTAKPYVLAIRSQGNDCPKNRLKMFFPFFRIFFCGARPCIKKNWLLLPFDLLTAEIEMRDFCVDGEKRRLGGVLKFAQTEVIPPIEVISPTKTERLKNYV